MKLSIIIPALNEAETLPKLIGDIPPVAGCDMRVVVVDNGSADNTARAAAGAGAEVVTEPRQGYGWACAAGVRASPEAEAVVFLDGDYSSDPAELPILIQPLLSEGMDMVLGSRLLSGQKHHMLPHQTFGNWLTAVLMRRLYGLAVTDLSPYRAVRADLLRALDLREMTFGYPTEMLVKAARRKARLAEVPVSFLPRYAGKSKISGTVRGTVLAGWHILGTTLRYAWG